MIHERMALRLAKYLRVLRKLKGLGFAKVFSNNLGDAVGATSAVVRKDLSVLQISGNKRGGYTIDVLIERLVDVLGKRDVENVIIVGCGRVGSALLNFQEFGREGIRVIAGFDSDENRVQENGHVPVYPVSRMAGFVEEHRIDVGILAVPDQVATAVFEEMIGAGIRGVLNFTSVELKCTAACIDQGCLGECVVHNVNIGLEIENLFYLVRIQRESSETLPAQKTPGS
jgi:redox-sensing transcriptional repressor